MLLISVSIIFHDRCLMELYQAISRMRDVGFCCCDADVTMCPSIIHLARQLAAVAILGYTRRLTLPSRCLSLTLSQLNWIIPNCKKYTISIFRIQIKHTWSHYNRLSEAIQMSTYHVWFGAEIKDLSMIVVDPFSILADLAERHNFLSRFVM